jgi:hypothetical protein
MLCYFDPNNNFAQGVPAPMLERVCAEREEMAKREFGIVLEGFGHGYVIANIGNAHGYSGAEAPITAVLGWLNAENICRVDIEARDVIPLWGRKDVGSVAIARGLQQGQPEIARLLTCLAPDEINEHLNQAMHVVFNDQAASESERYQENFSAAVDLSTLGVEFNGQDAVDAFYATEDARDALGPQPEPERAISEDFIAESPKGYIDPFDDRYYEQESEGY